MNIVLFILIFAIFGLLLGLLIWRILPFSPRISTLDEKKRLRVKIGFGLFAALCAAATMFLFEIPDATTQSPKNGIPSDRYDICQTGIDRWLGKCKFGDERSFRLDDDGNVANQSGPFWPIWCPVGQNCHTIPTAMAMRSSVWLVMQNPKVRRISYEILVEIVDAQKYFDHVSTESMPFREHKKNLYAIAQSVLSECNNAISRELAALYNPYDKGQRERLYSLLSGFVNPRLGPVGLKLTSLLVFRVD